MVTKLTFEEFKAEAKRRFEVGGQKTNHTNPISYLYSLDWNIPKEPPYDAYMLAEMNLNFDQRGCFGRTLRATVLWEQLFPQNKFYAATVCENFLRYLMLDGVTRENWNDETYIQEILQYEEDHVALVDLHGLQFDPNLKEIAVLNKLDPWVLKHPKVIQNPVWETLYCSYLISYALVCRENKDMDSYRKTLNEVYAKYPNSPLVHGNLVSALVADGNIESAIEFAKEMVRVRKDAKTLHTLWSLVNNNEKTYYKKLIVSEYSEEMFLYLEKNINNLTQQFLNNNDGQ